MGPRFYILNEHDEPVPVADAIEWARWFETHDEQRVVLQDTIDGTLVSTVFLGLDHAYDDRRVLIYETLVDGGDLNGEMERYATRDDAVAGHVAMCGRVRRGE
jgi:hypothetical protein